MPAEPPAGAAARRALTKHQKRAALGGRVRPHARRGCALGQLGHTAADGVRERVAKIAQRRAAGEAFGTRWRGALQDAADLVQRCLLQGLRLAPARPRGQAPQQDVARALSGSLASRLHPANRGKASPRISSLRSVVGHVCATFTMPLGIANQARRSRPSDRQTVLEGQGMRQGARLRARASGLGPERFRPRVQQSAPQPRARGWHGRTARTHRVHARPDSAGGGRSTDL